MCPQAGCRPWHLEMTYNITKFKEGLCVVKLMDGVRNQGSDQAAPQPEPLLPGVTIASADWPTGKLMSITHASGVGPWEKSWVGGLMHDPSSRTELCTHHLSYDSQT